MADHTSPPMPKWLHRWFWLWEDLAPGVYRVGAVISGAGITAAVLAKLTPVRWWLAAAASLATWIGLAIAQDHDERVTLPIDEDFLRELRTQVDPVVAGAGYSFEYADPANRARGGAEVFVYEVDRNDEFSDVIRIYRDRTKRILGIFPSGSFPSVETDLSSDLVERLNILVDPADDAKVIAKVLSLWLSDQSIRLPMVRSSARSREIMPLGRRSSNWFNYGPR